ncbi:MAG: hypothetical protein J0I41_06680 [Filimonas sp.]|nr:hypothetical protein [Filimonas sp.]
MYTYKHIQQIIARATMLSLLTICVTAIHAQQKTPDMSKFSTAPIAQGSSSSSAARVAATAPARIVGSLPSDQPASASAATTDNNKTMKSVNRTTAGAPSGSGMEQMSMQPAPEKVKPKQTPVKVPTQQN